MRRLFHRVFDWRRVGSWCGLAAPIIFIVCWAAAIASTPGYRFGGQWVSDLGVGGGAAYFNAGAIVSGVLTVPFAASLAKALDSERLGWFGALTLAGAGISLACIGVFTEDAGEAHLDVSVSFFVLMPMSLISLIHPFYKSAAMRPWGAHFTVIVALIGLGLLAVFQAGPLTETAVVAMIIVWSIPIAWRLRVYLCVIPPRTRSEPKSSMKAA